MENSPGVHIAIIRNQHSGSFLRSVTPSHHTQELLKEKIKKNIKDSFLLLFLPCWTILCFARFQTKPANNKSCLVILCRTRDPEETPKEGRKTYRPKSSEFNNEDEDNSPNVLNDKNHQASTQQFRQVTNLVLR